MISNICRQPIGRLLATYDWNVRCDTILTNQNENSNAYLSMSGLLAIVIGGMLAAASLAGDGQRHLSVAGHCMELAGFADEDRVAFLGDSITQGGRYLGYLQLFHCLRHSGSRAEFLNVGVSGDTAKGGLSRFDWDVAPLKPNRVFMMFGMNDVDHGLYADGKSGLEESDARDKVFAVYRDRLAKLSDKVSGLGARLTVMTPTPFDEYAEKASRASEKGCNEIGLARLAAIARETPNAGTVELHAPFTDLLKRHPGRFQPDRVHPGEEGHLLIAVAILMAEGETPTIAETVLSAVDLPYRYAPNAFPLPLTAAYLKADEVFPVTENLNRETLVIKGLERGVWALEADGRSIGTFTAEALAKGINLALLPTPNQLKAQSLAEVAADMATMMSRLRSLAQVRLDLGSSAGDFSDKSKVFAALDAANAERAARKDAYLDYYRDVAANAKKTWDERAALEAKVAAARRCLVDARPMSYELSVKRASK